MDRQRVTSNFLAEYGGAAAAYSLRALNGNGDNVVRVRRASDNDEKDFTAEQIKLGEMVNWVNSQIVPPLDIGVETSEGRIPVPEGGTSIGTPAAAYSLRNLSTTYTGNVVDVRRSSDDAEESFTATEVSDGTLEAWVGAGNDGTVSKWYDQSGNDNHAVQMTPANQPTIVDGGSLVTGGLDFDGVDDYLLGSHNVTSDYSFFTVTNDTGSSTSYIADTGINSGNGVNYGRTVNSSGNRQLTLNHGGFSSVNASGFLVGESLISQTYDSTTINASVNGSAVGTSIQGYTASGTTLTVGASGALGALFNGTMKELILYPSDQSDNRTAIEANIGEYYGITGIPAYDNTVDGFVETWYDQSGNGNDATQSVTGSQPKIVENGSVKDHLLFNGTNKFLTADDVATHVAATNPDISAFIVSEYANLSSSNFSFSFGVSTGSAPSAYVGSNTIPRHASIIINNSGSNSILSSGTPVANTEYVTSFFTTTEGSQSQFVNGTARGTGSLTVGAFSPTQFTIGCLRRNSNVGFHNGPIREIIIYPSDQSANRTAIEGNINAHYNIYP